MNTTSAPPIPPNEPAFVAAWRQLSEETLAQIIPGTRVGQERATEELRARFIRQRHDYHRARAFAGCPAWPGVEERR
ncbi:hypothetical protein K2Z83_15640 [Oscillochloris sp. ZM17-4]|uniref:hypothetical protein n=1 Tax=Oscillochloris sp. ZM17-4 TaxID=2866714 RepID=UPI001C730841|nr:hypothetical protein [Oscillochloris sp. ZM17-4]MBX0329110.1 hypothetical protein [Oscillochloris sp. ZM17-4]